MASRDWSDTRPVYGHSRPGRTRCSGCGGATGTVRAACGGTADLILHVKHFGLPVHQFANSQARRDRSMPSPRASRSVACRRRAIGPAAVASWACCSRTAGFRHPEYGPDGPRDCTSPSRRRKCLSDSTFRLSAVSCGVMCVFRIEIAIDDGHQPKAHSSPRRSECFARWSDTPTQVSETCVKPRGAVQKTTLLGQFTSFTRSVSSARCLGLRRSRQRAWV